MRKGQAEMLEWFPRLLMLLVAIIVIALLVRYFAYREVDASEIHRASYLARLHYDGNIITYRDDATGRVYPGTIDYSRFTPDRIDKTYGVTGKISSMLTLNGDCVERKAVWHDKATYERYIGFARFGTLGPGGATLQEEILPVTIVDGGERCPGMLNITVVRPNS